MSDDQENRYTAMIIAAVSLGIASVAADNDWYFTAMSSAVIFSVVLADALKKDDDDDDNDYPDCLGV